MRYLKTHQRQKHLGNPHCSGVCLASYSATSPVHPAMVHFNPIHALRSLSPADVSIFSQYGWQYPGIPGLINARSVLATLIVQVLGWLDSYLHVRCCHCTVVTASQSCCVAELCRVMPCTQCSWLHAPQSRHHRESGLLCHAESGTAMVMAACMHHNQGTTEVVINCAELCTAKSVVGFVPCDQCITEVVICCAEVCTATSVAVALQCDQCMREHLGCCA